MPLYECTVCHATDNTALTNFWWDVMHEKKPALCSECDPAIGKWHGEFPKITREEYDAKYPQCRVEYPANLKGERRTK